MAIGSAAAQAAVLGYLVPALVVGTGFVGGLDGFDGEYESLGTRVLYVLGSLITGALWLAISAQAVHEMRSRRSDMGAGDADAQGI